jgi:hypothetical protein
VWLGILGASPCHLPSIITYVLVFSSARCNHIPTSANTNNTWMDPRPDKGTDTGPTQGPKATGKEPRGDCCLPDCYSVITSCTGPAYCHIPRVGSVGEEPSELLVPRSF